MHTANDFKLLASRESNARLKTRYLALYHFKRGQNRTQIAEYLGVNRGSVNQWVSRYLTEGLTGLQDKAHPGRPPTLSVEQCKELQTFIESGKASPHGGRLVARDIQAYIQQQFGVKFKQGNVYRLLHQLGFSWITSRSKHPKQSSSVQDAYKKVSTGNDPSHTRKCVIG